ncbi:hypothetical protein EDB86DRAFT_2830456 [Lactarius hatsudake]|nr:hypothetical protein EDB86DRAFT_2830456 [Lactarius hatsudake]
MRRLPTAMFLLSALYASAQPADQGKILACYTVETGTAATPTLESNGLPPPNDPSLLVGFFCEPLAPGFLVSVSRDAATTVADYPETGSNEDFTGFVGVDCEKVLGT